MSHPPSKKARTHSNSAITSLLHQNLAQLSSPSPSNNGQQDGSSDFSPIFSEIADIMRGYGDCENPLKESVILVEKIVHQQLKGIFQEAMTCALARKGENVPSETDFYFLMRKSPQKLFRLQKHLKDLEFRRRIQDMLSGRPGGFADENYTAFEDPSRELIEKYDEEKIRRMFRADRISQMLTGNQYQHFILARRTSFYHRAANVMKNKLRNWLNVPQEIQLSPHVVSTLCYLINETVATIVDLAILTRLNSDNRIVDPFNRVAAHPKISHQMLHLCPDVSQGRANDGVKPVTVQEINEALRRHAFMVNRSVGKFRNFSSNTPYLAL